MNVNSREFGAIAGFATPLSATDLKGPVPFPGLHFTVAPSKLVPLGSGNNSTVFKDASSRRKVACERTSEQGEKT